MNNFTYENQGTNTYLVYKIGESDSVDTMSLGMLTNNKISGLAQTLFTQMDIDKYIKYNVSSKVAVSHFFSGAVNKKRLVGVFLGIVNAVLSAEEYMLDENTILLDMNYIFTDVSTCETVLICLPLFNTEIAPVDFRTFFRNVMFSTQFDQTENCDHIARIINYLNGTPVFSLIDFKKLLEEIDGKTEQPIVVKVKREQTAIKESTQKEQRHLNVEKKALEPQNTKPVELISDNKTMQNTLPQNNGMNIPIKRNVMEEQIQKTDNGQEISLFYLLQHYNKENAAAYKAQKEAKKGKKEVVEVGNTVKEPKKKKDKKNKSEVPQSFAIPGQTPSQGFAIPSQQPMVQSTPVQQTNVPQEVNNVQPSVTSTQQKTNPANLGGYQPATAPQGKALNFGETTVLSGGGIGETTVLNASMLNQQQTITPHLIRSKNNEKIMVNKPVFRIGKERSYVDYFIGDNSGISRSHANIITREGRYFVVDTNSTNHTFVNGAIIQSNEEVEIVHGDKIRFANEDFEFKLY